MKDFIEYYEKIKNDKVHIINIDTTKFIVREITWKEGLLIDAKSFRKKDNIIYQNSEFEKREILKLSILRVYDTKNNVDFISEFESSLLNKIDHVTIEKLWLEFQKYLYLSADEANFYYVSAKKYFNPNHTETFPVPPLLVEIDYMIRGLVSMSKDEFSNISMKEFETIQLILATKNEVKSENAVDLKNFEVEKDL
jgi:predicted transcriptional regulator